MVEEGYNKGFDKEVTGEVERKPLDISPYVGKKVRIATVTEIPRSEDGQGIGKYGACIKVETEIVDVIEKDDGGQINLRGSKLFGLVENDDGTLSWGGKLQQFLNAHNKEHYRELLGVEVQLVPKPSTKDPKTKFLTFE